MSSRVMSQAARFVPVVQQAPGLVLQRKCACGQHTGGGSCASCAKKEDSLQRRATTTDGAVEIPPIVHEVLSSPGQQLDTATRAFMEPRFRHDFSQVRIHGNAKAGESARAVNAEAFTVGSQIVFDSGKFAPGTREGKNLLAHELTHVLQQTHGLTRSAPAGVGPVDDEHERQADAVAHAIIDVPGKPAVGAAKAEIPGTHRVATRNDPPTPPKQIRLQRKTDDEEESFDDKPLGGPTEQASGAKTKPTCPKVPTHRGDDIPKPLCPTATHTGSNELKRFNFCLDSDELTDPTQLDEVESTVNSVHQSTRFLIHGYASSEGRKDYNFRLACHRAVTIAKAVRAALTKRLSGLGFSGKNLDAEVESRIETASQGPTTEFGKAESNRVAIVFGQIPGEQDEEPSCDKAPRKMGNITPDIGCDVPTQDLTKMPTGKHLTHFHFCLDSDVFAKIGAKDVRSFAHGQAASAQFIVHGFASIEGPADYNQRLSCHRALRVYRELINAGVKAEQITEVSGLGETNVFDPNQPEFNRLVVVLAKGGDIGEIPEGTRPARTREQKKAARDEARDRLMAGNYNLGADAYISFWTCGRTATVRQAIERLTIEVKDDNVIENLREKANGTEEGFGVNFVRLSNVAIGADNAIECIMGRLIDMAFHHAVLGNPDLPSDLITPFDPNAKKDEPQADPKNKEARHQAGLHLIHLAGLGACTGGKTEPQQRADDLGGIDQPLEDDPRTDMPAPGCAEAPQPTRLHPPAAGAKGREMPDFNLVGQPHYEPTRGKLNSRFDTEQSTEMSMLVTTPDKGIINASATLQFSGQQDTFRDYEAGFIQAVIADEGQTDYDSGHSVIQQLPTPIRLAEMKGAPKVPEPWTSSKGFARPGNDGKVTVTSTASGLNTNIALPLRLLKATLPASAMQTFEQGSRIAIWLAVRRLGAPLDRFSVRFIDGVIYDLTQLVHLEHRRKKGDIRQFPEPGLEEKELAVFPGSFLASKSSELPEDPASARLTRPIASEIALRNQIRKVVEPTAATERDMGPQEVRKAVAEILDNLVLFEDETKARKGEGGTKMPRLGFDFIPLTITLPIVRHTGRLLDPEPDANKKNKIVVEVKGPGLGSDAAQAIAQALEFRIRDRESQGQAFVVRPSAVPGGGNVGNVIVRLDPLGRQAGDTRPEAEMIKRPEVLRDMSEAWACTLATKQRSHGLDAREFGRSYALNRERDLQLDPPDRIKMGCPDDLSGGHRMILPCPAPSDGVTLGGFHTHPEPDIPPVPTPSENEDEKSDLDFARECGSEAYIVTDFKAFRYFANGKVGPQINLEKITTCNRKHLVEDPACGKPQDEL